MFWLLMVYQIGTNHPLNHADKAEPYASKATCYHDAQNLKAWSPGPQDQGMTSHFDQNVYGVCVPAASGSHYEIRYDHGRKVWRRV